MANYYTIHELTDRGTVAGTDEVEIQVSGETVTKRSLLSAIYTYIRSAITATPADITTLTGSQTLTNKTLTTPRCNTPKFNEDVTMTASSTELNKMDGVTVTTAEINMLAGIGATAITTLLAAKANATDLNNLAYLYTATFTTAAAETTQTITAATIITGANVPAGQVILVPCNSQVYMVNGFALETQDPATVKTDMTWHTTAGQVHLVSLDLKGLTAEKSYYIAVSFKTAPTAT
jgi:hypothetical protein